MKQIETVRLRRLPWVKEVTGLPKISIYRRINEGSFPRQVPLGPNSVAWVESEVLGWIRERISLRDETESRKTEACDG